MRRELPSGTVTFLFTDVEGSTKLLHDLGAERYAQALAGHRRILREAFTRYGGVEVDTQGDAFFVAFPTAPGAVEAVEEMLTGLASGPIRVRMGLHTGTPYVAEEGYVGVDVNRAARIASCGHGGQVLLSSSTAALLGTDALRDLGEHRLKDLSAPERIFQLGDADFPPLKSLHQTNLPIPATPFVGREHELGELRALVAREDVRLLTLTGPGGTGKTRLALQTAAEAAEAFAGGVWWVPLAPLRDPAIVVAEAAKALGAKDALAEHIGDRSLLLFFDNFEHVVDAANELPPLLADCPNLRILVTSREVLRLPGEQVYPVPPLEPDEGKELFLARARAANAAFEPNAAVDELCGRLENLPLALELAAARVRMLAPQQLLERLGARLDLLRAGRGVDPRQQTLRATIEWSHELLEADEQRLFARLAVFAGGCTVDAAERVCDADLDTLQSLVDKSLVRVRDGDRFWMLETIREYALERLDTSGEADELRRRHAEYFLELAEEAEPHLRNESSEWLDRLEREHDNLRAALDRFELAADGQSALRLAASAWRLWSLRGPLAEGRRRVESALAGDPRPTPARANVLNGAADLAQDAGDVATSRLRAQESLALHGAFDDQWGTAEALLLLGLTMTIEGEWSSALPRFVESARLFRELGDEHMELEVTRRLAWAYESLGDRERARVIHEENVARARAIGDEFVEARSLGTLAQYRLDDGDAIGATAMLVEAHRIHRPRRDLPDRYSDALIVCRFARALALQGRAATAAMLLACSEVLFEEIGVTAEGWVGTMNDVTRTMIRRHIDEVEFASASEDGRSLSLDDAVGLARPLLEPAHVAARGELPS